MSDKDEEIMIVVMSKSGRSIRTITNEAFVEDTQWPHLVEVFLEQLQGLGYKFFATPEEMVDVLEEYHQELMCAECDSCKEDKPVAEEKKYPYTGVYKRDESYILVEFIAPNTGKCIYSTVGSIGEYATNWAEEDFEKVSK